MEILRTHQISAAVIDLIEETKEHCYLVTPYLRPWPILERAFAKARELGTKLTLIVRHEAKAEKAIMAMNDVYGFEVIVLERLHTKLYLNEKTAVVSSMNLYDSSNENNYELALRIRIGSQVRQLRKEIIEQDLLALSPRLHLPGRFQAEVEARAKAVTTFREELKSRGFCVSCAEKIDFDQTGSILSPRIVRCKPCWAMEPWIEAEYRWPIKFCHYCGEGLQSVLAQPYHHGCHERLKEFRGMLN